MAVELREESGGKVLAVRVSGKLTKEDYGHFVPEIERLILQHGKLRLLCEMQDFHGWTAGALWEDFKFDLKHFRDIERLAIVGETKWQKNMAVFCKPFTMASVRYFEHSQANEALAWLVQP